MAISSTPSASEINVELGRTATDPFNINGAEERALAEVPTGPISFSDFIGKSSVKEYTMTAQIGANINGFSAYGTLVGGITPSTYNGIDVTRVAETVSGDGYHRFSLGQASLSQTYFSTVKITGITDPNWAGGPVTFDTSLADLFIANESGNTAWFWTFAVQYVQNHQYKVEITA